MERAKHVSDIGDWVHISTALSKVWENINKVAQSPNKKASFKTQKDKTMNDQTPIKVGLRYEKRTEVTYLDEADWAKAVHRLMMILDNGFERSEKRQGVLHLRQERARVVTELRKDSPSKKEMEALKQEIRDFLSANPRTGIAEVLRLFPNISETTVRRIRRALRLPPLYNGRALIERLRALLEKYPELSNDVAARRIGAALGYTRKLRRMIEAEKAREAS